MIGDAPLKRARAVSSSAIPERISPMADKGKPGMDKGGSGKGGAKPAPAKPAPKSGAKPAPKKK
jgi:hypothetical protein